MLAALGEFIFGLATFPFADLSRRSDWRHARTPRLGARDATQFLGPGDETLQLSGVLVPGVGGSYTAIATLRRMADAGEEYPFVDGAGNVWGNFRITGLDERRKYLLVDGTPMMIDFAIDLDRVS